ncbi:MAG: hypothetical protein Tsb0014_38970 [Pleurocapsa sp.]
MTTQEEARRAMAQARRDGEHLQDNLLHRSQEIIEQSSGQEIEETARELMTEQRQEDQHLKETMLSRSEAEIENTEV